MERESYAGKARGVHLPVAARQLRSDPMRNGLLGAIVVLTAGASLAWGQYPPPPGPSYPGGPSTIPPPVAIPGGTGGYEGQPNYPPPANWEGIDPNGPPRDMGASSVVPRWWMGAEYLMFFAKSSAFNIPIATTSSPGSAGVLGNADTRILYGNSDIPYNFGSGFRVFGGWYFDDSNRYGIEISGFNQGKQSRTFTLDSATFDSPVIAQPFVNAITGAQSSLVVATPGFSTGVLSAVTSTQIWGVEANGLMNIFRTAPGGSFGYNLNFLLGFRFAMVTEDIQLSSTSTLLNNGATATINNQTFAGGFTTNRVNTISGTGAVTTVVTDSQSTVQQKILDQFHTRNEFYGGNLGMTQDFRFGRFTLGMTAKLGLGDMHQIVDIHGLSNVVVGSDNTVTTRITDPNGVPISNTATTTHVDVNHVAVGGLYAQSNLVGRYQTNTFAVLPDLGFTFACQITPHISTYFGYNFLYFSQVVRPFNLINGTVNTALQPTSPNFGAATVVRPINLFPNSDFSVQTIRIGLNIAY